MAITFTRSKLILILVIFFTVLVAGLAVGTAVLLNKNGVGGTDSKAASCTNVGNLATLCNGNQGVSGDGFINTCPNTGAACDPVVIKTFIDAGYQTKVVNETCNAADPFTCTGAQTVQNAAVTVRGSAKVGLNNTTYGTVACGTFDYSTAIAPYNEKTSGSTDVNGLARVDGLNCFNAPFLDKGSDPSKITTVSCPAGTHPDDGSGGTGGFNGVGGACIVQTQPACTNDHQEKNGKVICKCLTNIAPTTPPTDTPVTPPTATPTPAPQTGSADFYARCGDGNNGGSYKLDLSVFQTGQPITYQIANGTFNVSATTSKIGTANNMTPGQNYNYQIGVTKTSNVYVSGFEGACKVGPTGTIQSGQACTIVFNGCTSPTPVPETLSVQVKAKCTDNPNINISTDAVAGQPQPGVRLYDNGQSTHRLEKVLPFTFSNLTPNVPFVLVPNVLTKTLSNGATATLRNKILVNGVETALSTISPVTYNSGYQYKVNPTQAGIVLEYQYDNCNVPPATTTPPPVTTRVPQSTPTNTPTVTPSNTPIPTTSIAPPPSSYNWNIKSYCDEKEVSGAVFSYNGDKGSTATNQSTPRDNLSALTGETVNVVCGGYYDSTTSTTKNPTTANQTVNSSNTNISCKYTGCSLPPTTTPPPVTTPPPPPVEYYCAGTTVSLNGGFLQDRAQVNSGDNLTIKVLGSSTATGGTGYDLSIVGGTSSSDSSSSNPGVFNYTVPATGTDISIIGYAKKPDGTKINAAICNFNLSLNHVKGTESYVLEKTSSPQSVLPGGTFTVNLRASNIGTTDVTIKEITDIMPDGFSYAGSLSLTNQDGTTATITESTTGNKTVFTINSGTGVVLPQGKYFNISFKMKATSNETCTTYQNVAMVSNPVGPSGQSNMSVCKPTTVLPNTGIIDNLVMSLLIGGGLIAISYASYRYNLAEKLNLLIKKRK